MGTEIPRLSWRINSTYRVNYELFINDSFPLSISWSPPLPDVAIIITNASFSESGQNIESTLTASVSDLRGSFIECFSSENTDESNTTVQEHQGSF